MQSMQETNLLNSKRIKEKETKLLSGRFDNDRRNLAERTSIVYALKTSPRYAPIPLTSWSCSHLALHNEGQVCAAPPGGLRKRARTESPKSAAKHACK